MHGMNNIKYNKDMGDNRRSIPPLQPFVYTSNDHSEKQKMKLLAEDIVVEK
jgi:hypothetical protein